MIRFPPFVKIFLSVLLPAMLFAITAGGCASMSTPPGADVTAGGVFEQTGFEFLRWEQGLAIMIWHDFVGESGSYSTSENTGFAIAPVYKLRGYAESREGDRFDWEVQTTDGKTAQFWLDGAPYDLADGGLFIVRMKNGRVDITQLDRDLSRVQPTYSSCLAFAQSDPDLTQLIGDRTASTLAPPTTVPDLTTPSQTPAETITSTAASTIERIQFAPGATQATVEGYLPANSPKAYVMRVAAGQFIEVNAAVDAIGQGLRFSIVGADGTIVKAMGEAHVRAVVPSTQDYFITLMSDVGPTHYHMSVLIPVRIRFAPGAISTEVEGSLAANGIRRYVLHALAGQRLIIVPRTTQGQVKLIISGADGQVLLSGHVGPPGDVFDGPLPTTQDYLLSVRAEGGNADYVLDITIPADEAGADVTIIGTVLGVSPSARIIMLREPVRGFSTVALSEECELISHDGSIISISAIRPAMMIKVTGRPGKSNALLASKVLVLDEG